MSDKKSKLKAMEFDPNKFPEMVDMHEALKGDLIERFSDVLIHKKSHVELLRGRADTYQIDSDRLDSADKVLGWILHLSEKGWVTARHIRALVVSAQRYGAKIDRRA